MEDDLYRYDIFEAEFRAALGINCQLEWPEDDARYLALYEAAYDALYEHCGKDRVDPAIMLGQIGNDETWEALRRGAELFRRRLVISIHFSPTQPTI